MPNQNKDNPSNWLTRQWQRVRGKSKRDVVIAQVGDHAENVAVGKNIWQINIGGRNLTLPIFVATACLLAIVGYFLFRQFEYLWNPTQMTGVFNIAVAELGEVSASGDIRESLHGAALSEVVFNSIRRQYDEHPSLDPEDVVIWHDSTSRNEKNVPIGVITGRTAKERAQKALEITEKINADLLIFGQLASADAADSLELEFYYRSRKIRNEFDLTQGQHRVGAPLVVSPSFAQDSSLARLKISDPLAARAKALSLVAIGLTYDVLGDVENSLLQFQLAQEHFDDLDDQTGLESLYFFMGRSSLFLQDHVAAEDAFSQAIALDPTYTRAYIGLGGVYLTRSQPPIASDRLEEASNLERAIETYETGLLQAQNSENELHQAIGHLALGSAYRVRGEWSYFAPEEDRAKEDVDAISYFSQAIDLLTSAVPILAEEQQYRLLAQAYLSQGAAHYQLASLFRRRGDQDDNIEALRQAKQAFTQCVEQKENAPEDEILLKQIISDSCQPRLDQTEELLASPKEP